MNAKFEQLEAAMNTKLDLLLKAHGNAAPPHPSEQVKAVAVTCSYCGSMEHETIECQYYSATIQQGVLDEQLYQVDNYNPERHSSQLNNHPHYSYGKRHVENAALTNSQGHQGGSTYQGGNNYQGGISRRKVSRRKPTISRREITRVSRP